MFEPGSLVRVVGGFDRAAYAIGLPEPVVEVRELLARVLRGVALKLVHSRTGEVRRIAASDPALAAKLMAGAPNQASHKMRK